MPCAASARSAWAVPALIWPARACEPSVASVPSHCTLSFTATGTPCSGPSTMPAASSRSAASACASARSAVTTLRVERAGALDAVQEMRGGLARRQRSLTDGAADAEGVLEVQGGIGCGHGAS